MSLRGGANIERGSQSLTIIPAAGEWLVLRGDKLEEWAREIQARLDGMVCTRASRPPLSHPPPPTHGCTHISPLYLSDER